MGVLYYAVNHQTNKAYELGKGAWFLLAPKYDEGIRTADVSIVSETLAIITQIMGDGTWNKETANDAAYKEEIAKALSSIGPIVEIYDDSTWGDPLEGIEIVGTRYRNIK